VSVDVDPGGVVDVAVWRGGAEDGRR